MQLEDLVGKHILSGIEVGTIEIKDGWYVEETNYLKFVLDGTCYFASENPSDGYRSYMNDLRVIDETCEIPLPNVEVVCHMKEVYKCGADDTLIFIDAANGKKILEIGTDYSDEWYPYCVLEYIPENMSCNEGGLT